MTTFRNKKPLWRIRKQILIMRLTLEILLIAVLIYSIKIRSILPFKTAGVICLIFLGCLDRYYYAIPHISVRTATRNSNRNSGSFFWLPKHPAITEDFILLSPQSGSFSNSISPMQKDLPAPHAAKKAIVLKQMLSPAGNKPCNLRESLFTDLRI